MLVVLKKIVYVICSIECFQSSTVNIKIRIRSQLVYIMISVIG